MEYFDRKRREKAERLAQENRPIEPLQQVPQQPQINPPTRVPLPNRDVNSNIKRPREVSKMHKEESIDEEETDNDEADGDEREEFEGRSDDDNPEDDADYDESRLLEQEDVRQLVHEGLDKGLTIPEIHRGWEDYYCRGSRYKDIKKLTVQAITSHTKTWKPKSADGPGSDVEPVEKPTPKRAPKSQPIVSNDPIDHMFNEFLDRIRKKDQKESFIDTYLSQYRIARDEGDVQMAKLMLIMIEKEFDRIETTKAKPTQDVDPVQNMLYGMLQKVVDGAVGGEGKSRSDAFDDAMDIVDRIDKVRGGGNNMPMPDDSDSWMWYTMGQVIPQSVDKITDAIGNYAGHGSLKDTQPMKQGTQPSPQQQVGFRCDACKTPVPMDAPHCQKCGNRFPPEMWRNAKQQMGIPDQQYMGQQPPHRPQFPAHQAAPPPQNLQAQPRRPVPPPQETLEPEEEIPDNYFHGDGTDEEEPYDPEIHGLFCSYCGGRLDEEGFCPKCPDAEDEPENVGPHQSRVHEIIPQPQQSPPIGEQKNEEKGSGEIEQASEGMGLSQQPLPVLPSEAIHMFNQLHRVAIWVKNDAKARQDGDPKGIIDPVNKASSLYRLADKRGKDLDLIKSLLYIRKRGIENMVNYVNLYSHDSRIKEAEQVVTVLSSEAGYNWCKKALDTVFGMAQHDGIHLTEDDISRLDTELRIFSHG